MGNFSPAYYDDQLLHKVKGVVLRVLDELNDVGEIVHARSLAPTTRRSRPVSISEQQDSEQATRVNIQNVHYSYEQFVSQLDGDDKFLKRLVEILIKETAVQAHQRQVDAQRAEASTSSGDAPSPSRTISPPISLSRLARSSLIQRPGVTLRDDGPVPFSVPVTSRDTGATEVPVTFNERDSRVAAGNLFPGSRRRRRAEPASTSSDEEVEVASTRTFHIGDVPSRLPEVELGNRFADALRGSSDDLSFTFPPAQPPLQTGGTNSVPFPGDAGQADDGNSDSGLASRLTALRASLNRMRTLRSEVAGSRHTSSASSTRSTSLQRSPAIRMRNSSGNLRRAAAAAAAASAFEDRSSTTRMTSLDRSRALGRAASTTSVGGIPWRNRAESAAPPLEADWAGSSRLETSREPGSFQVYRPQATPSERRADAFAAFAARRRTEARQGQEEQNVAARSDEGPAPRVITSLAPASPSSFSSSVDSNRRDWDLELRTIDEHIASIRGRTAALRQRQDELLRSYDRGEGGDVDGDERRGFVAAVVDENGVRRAAQPEDWMPASGASPAHRRIAGSARVARGRPDEAEAGDASRSPEAPEPSLR